MTMNRTIPATAWLVGTLATMAGVASQAAGSSLTDLSLAQLMDEPVTSVSKKETRLGDSPTAITVITAEDIRRNGITSIPEALRLVPGVDVARIDASHWAISVRGFNLEYTPGLLVLIDGRSVYTPSFGGVFWDAQDMALEDLDRIEVIRGPGATLWGANAVNGVINVISKSARDTQGGYVSAGFGSEDQPSLDARYGGALGTDANYRVYAKYFDREGMVDAHGRSEPQNWHSVRVGFRTDWEPGAQRRVTVQGDYYSLDSSRISTVPTFVPPFSSTSRNSQAAEGGNLLGRWTQTLSEVSQVSVQVYLDSYSRDFEKRSTGDVELEHRFTPFARHDVVWGMGYRFTTDDLHLGDSVVTTPETRDMNLYTAFVQDEITLVPERLRFTAGAKFEHNDFTGFELQPNLRLLWTPATGHTAWVSASRAVSNPSRFLADSRFSLMVFPVPASPLVELALMPTPGLQSSKVTAYEAGYRIEPAPSLSADLATYYSVHRQLYAAITGAPFFEATPVPHLVLPVNYSATGDGVSYGAELSVSWRPVGAWSLTAAYSFFHLRMEGSVAKSSPAHQASLVSHAALPYGMEFNSAVYYVANIDSLNSALTTMAIPSYVRVDSGLVFHPSTSLEWGIWGQNLLDPRHAESTTPQGGPPSEIPRSVAAKITKHF